MTGQALVAGAALIAFGAVMLGYGIGWGQCTAWRSRLDSMPLDDEVNLEAGVTESQKPTEFVDVITDDILGDRAP